MDRCEQQHRAQIVAAARDWLGTPYRHQHSTRGVGCDCLGLVRGVWRTVLGAEPEPLPAYTPDWAEATGEETLHAAACRWLLPADLAQVRPGDVVLFRMARSAPMKHAAIVTGAERIIHAYWGRAVVESSLVPWWRRRMAAAFVFPVRGPAPRPASGPAPGPASGPAPGPASGPAPR